MRNRIGILVLLLVGGSILLGRAMNAPLNHDEHQFIASAQLLVSRGLLPYIDYTYFHMPNMVFINSLAVAASSHDFLAVRVLGVVWSLGLVVLVYYLALDLLPANFPVLRQLGALSASLVIILDPMFLLADGRALNHMLPGLLSLLAFAACRQGLREQAGWKWFILCGILSGLAAGTRFTYTALIVVYAAAAVLLPKVQSLRARLAGAAALGAGTFVSLLPTLALFLAAPQQFFFGNYMYIRLNTLYRQAVQHDVAMDLASKLIYFIRNVFGTPLDASLYSVFIVISAAAVFRWWRSREDIDPGALLAAGTGIALFTTAFAPTPTYPQYFFAPLPFLMMAFLYGLSWLARRKALYGYLAIGTLAVLALLSGAASYVRNDLAKLGQPSGWVTVEMHNFAMQIRAQVPVGRVLTLAPAFPLEAGLDIYEPFAVGPFAWRTAHLVGAEQRATYGIVARKELDNYLASAAPAAVLVGFETANTGFGPYDLGKLEKPLEDYARRASFHFQEMDASFTHGPVILWTP